MAKESISATIEDSTISGVKEMAKKEKRSFSQMVDVLLSKAIKEAKSSKAIKEAK